MNEVTGPTLVFVIVVAALIAAIVWWTLNHD